MNITKIKAGEVISYKHNEDNKDVSAVVLGRVRKSTGRHKTWFNLQEITGIQQSADLQQVKDLKLHEMNHTNTRGRTWLHERCLFGGWPKRAVWEFEGEYIIAHQF